MKSKYRNRKKLILTDADGCLLDWEWAFNVWMQEHGFEEIPGSKLNYDMAIRYGIPREQVVKLIRIFNESAAIGFLPAQRDAMYYVKKLVEKMYEHVSEKLVIINRKRSTEKSANIKKRVRQYIFRALLEEEQP